MAGVWRVWRAHWVTRPLLQAEVEDVVRGNLRVIADGGDLASKVVKDLKRRKMVVATYG